MKQWVGIRARIGVIVIDSSRNIEPEFYAMCPQGVSVHATRIALSTCDVRRVTSKVLGR